VSLGPLAVIVSDKVYKAIGEGAHGVFLGAEHITSRQKVVIGSLDRATLADRKMLVAVERATRIHLSLNHPHTVKALRVEYSREFICIMLELGRGDLLMWIKTNR